MNYIGYSEDTITMNSFGTDSETIDNPPQTGGGAVARMFGLQKNDSLALQACADKNYAVFMFFVVNNMISDYSIKDCNTGKNMFHFLPLFWENYTPEQRDNIFQKMANQCSNIANVINHQDHNGCTPLHYAAENGHNDLCDKYCNVGATLGKITDKNSRVVQRKSTGDYDSINVTIVEGDLNITSDDRENVPVQQYMPMAYSNQNSVFAKPVTPRAPNRAPAPSTLGFDNMSSYGAAQSTLGFNNMPSYNGSTLEMRDTTQQDSMRQFTGGKQVTSTFDMPSHLSSSSSAKSSAKSSILDTDQFISRLVVPGNVNLKGGAKKSPYVDKSKNKLRTQVFGSRHLNLYSEQDGSETNDTNSDFSEMSGGDKKPTVVDEIHNRTVKYIMNTKNISEEDAKIYKGIIYRRVKELHPEFNGIERATEMEKIVTTTNDLDNISVKQFNEIKKQISQKHNDASSSELSPDEKQKKPKKTSKAKKSSKIKDTSNSSEPLWTFSSTDFI